jgi:hypothetical protein
LRVPHEPEESVGVLVIRASVEDHDGPRLLVHLVEVRLRLPDRTVGVVSSAPAALDLVREWLEALVAQPPGGGDVLSV